jgi:cell division protein FtsA
MAGKPIIAAGLDVGSSQTRLVVCALEKNRLRLIGCGVVPSQGWVKGKIFDQRAVTESILVALSEAESTAGVTTVESVVAGMGGPTVRGANSRGVLEMGYVREIEQRDINRVVDRATRVQLQEDRMLLQVFPQDFVVDDHPGHRNPIRMDAARLESNVHLLMCSVQEHTALVTAVNQAHLTVDETVFEGLAAAYAAVLPEHRGRASPWSISARNPPNWWCTTATPCTWPPRQSFRRSLHPRSGAGPLPEFRRCRNREAGIRFGAGLESSAANAVVDLPTPESREYRHADRRFVNEILQARAEELFRFVRSELVRVGWNMPWSAAYF